MGNFARSILYDDEMEFPTDTDHIVLPNTVVEVKQQSIDENELFIETELKKNERDVETLEKLINHAKCDLIKTFTNPSHGIIVDYVK